MRFRLAILVFAAQLCLAKFCLAQPLPDPAAYLGAGAEQTSPFTRAWLYSGAPRNAAWAAFFIARDSERELIPNLIAQLDTYHAQSSITRLQDVTDSDAMIQAVADALIQLNAAPPADAIMRLYPRFQAQAVILLSRAPDNRDALRTVFEDKRKDTWLAAANLLAPQPPPGFVKELLDNFEVEADVAVLDPLQPEPGGVGGGCASDWLQDKPDRFKAWPPVSEYGLTVDRQAREHNFAPGIHNVSYYTWTTTDFEPHPESGDCGPGRDNGFRLGLLSQVAGMSLIAFPLHEFEPLSIHYNGAAAYHDRLQAFLGGLGASFAKVKQIWASHGAITVSETAALKLRVALRISDTRVISRETLPATPDLVQFGIVRP